MKFIHSYKVELNVNKAIKETILMYRGAVSFIVNVANIEWTKIEPLRTKERVNFVEKLVHETKENKAPLYDFDKYFYKFPSYLRRSAIQDALGIVSSYKSNLYNYKKEKYNAISKGKKFQKKAPKLSLNHYKCPALFKGNMYIRTGDETAKIKIFKNGDWVWLPVKLNKQDVKYIQRNCYHLKELSPILVSKGRKAYLSFPFQGTTKLETKKLEERKIVSVDLGLNHSAVCSVMFSNGTVTNRLFINQSVEKDHLKTALNRLKLNYKKYKNYSKKPKIWSKINGLNTQITNDTVCRIVNFAKENKANVIVFEYLDFKGKKPKNIAMRLQLWAKREIQSKVTQKAHSYGIRVNRICAKNTSLLSFDGSGKVKRDKHNAKLCIFATGKKYNCDLNACYNIGARYFIKEIQKTISEKKWSIMNAKVPSLERRTQCTLSTLLQLVAIV